MESKASEAAPTSPRPRSPDAAVSGANPAASFAKVLQTERGGGEGGGGGGSAAAFPICRPKIPALSTVAEDKEANHSCRSPTGFTRAAIVAAAAASFNRRAFEAQGRLSTGSDLRGRSDKRDVSFSSDSLGAAWSPERLSHRGGRKQNARYSLGSVAELRSLDSRDEPFYGWDDEQRETPFIRASIGQSGMSDGRGTGPLMNIEVGAGSEETLQEAHSPVYTHRFSAWEGGRASPAFSARSEPGYANISTPVRYSGTKMVAGRDLLQSPPPYQGSGGKPRRHRSVSSDWEPLRGYNDRLSQSFTRSATATDVSIPTSRRSLSDRYSFDATVLDPTRRKEGAQGMSMKRTAAEKLGPPPRLSDVVRDAAMASHLRRQGPTKKKNLEFQRVTRELIHDLASASASTSRGRPVSLLSLELAPNRKEVAAEITLRNETMRPQQQNQRQMSSRVEKIMSPMPPQTPIADILGIDDSDNNRRAFSLEREEGFPFPVMGPLPVDSKTTDQVQGREGEAGRRLRSPQKRAKPPLKLQLSVNGIASMARPSISYSQGSSLASSPNGTDSPNLFSPQITPTTKQIAVAGFRGGATEATVRVVGADGKDVRLSPRPAHLEVLPGHCEPNNLYMPLSPEELDLLKEQSFEAAERAGPVHLGDSIVLLKELGRGASGIVYMALYVPTLKLVAVKRLQVYKEEHQQMVMQELRGLHENLVPIEVKSGPFVLQFFSQEDIGREHICPFIVGFYGAYAKPQESCVDLVIEYMDGGCLQDILDRGGIKNEIILAHIAHSALSALAYLHKQRMVHRDIKPANLLVNYHGDVKVSDFGLATTLAGTTAHAREFQGTMIYMAPERIMGGQYSYPSDVWSIGLVLFSLALGKFPFDLSEGFFGVEEAICHDPLPPLPRAFSPDFRDFVLRCLLEREPSKRITAADALRHPFIVQNLKVEEIGKKMLRHDWITIMGNHDADVKRVQLIARTAVENILQKILKKKEEMNQRKGFRNSMKIALTRPFHIKRWPTKVVQSLAKDYGLKEGVVNKIIDHYRRKANKMLEPEVATVDQNRTRPKAYAMAMASRR